jgi:hypothetical protein
LFVVVVVVVYFVLDSVRKLTDKPSYIGGTFEKFADWRQCAAVMQREAVIVTPSCSGGGNIVT